MQSKSDAGTLGQLKNFIWQSLQIKSGKHHDSSSQKADKLASNKLLSPERILRSQNNYANMPTATSLRIQEWQKSQNNVDQSLSGNSDYVQMDSPKRPYDPRLNGLQRDCNYVNYDTESSRRSPDYVNMDGDYSDLRTNSDYVNLRPEDPSEPRPLTRMNVTLHDQIWSQEDPRGVTVTPAVENTLLSPPLKHINPNQFWYHGDHLDISDSVSDKSGSSGDTMIMMTSAEAKRNEANIEKSTQEYENRKSKSSDDGINSNQLNNNCEVDYSMCGNSDNDNVVDRCSASNEELDIDSVLDEGYGTDSRGSTTNSMSTPLSSSLSSLYSGDADPVSRQPHTKLTPSAMKRHIELIPKGRIANFRKVQFTARRTKNSPETNSSNSNSLQQKIMELAIIDEENENESLTASSGSEKTSRSAKGSDDGSVNSPLRTHHRPKTERTVRWLDEENAKKSQTAISGVELRVKPAGRQINMRPKSYSGEVTPSLKLSPTRPFADSAINGDQSSAQFQRSPDRMSSHSLGSPGNQVRPVVNGCHVDEATRPGILRHGPKNNNNSRLQRHSVASPLDSLSNSRAQWRSEVDISRPSRNLEFCSSSQIYDRMRAMTRPQGGRPNDSSGNKTRDDDHVRNTGADKSSCGVQGRPVFATTADIIKLFQSQSKADSFVRSQRHSFNTIHHKKDLQTLEFGKDLSSDIDTNSHYRSASNICQTSSKRDSKPDNWKRTVSPQNGTNGKKNSLSSPLHTTPSRTKLSPPPIGQALSLSKLSTLV